MRRRWITMFCGLLMSFAVACDSGGETDSSSEPGTGSSPAATTAWSVDTQGTSQVPAYGNSCRFEAANHLAMAGNGEADDSVTLVKSGSAYQLDLSLSDGAGGEVSFALELSQGLALRSYRNGTGAAQAAGSLASMSGTVQDAALCFESKLAPAESVRGEFSVVVLNAAGEYVSMGGDFVLSADSVFPQGSASDDLLVGASGLMVDLE